MKRLLFKIKLFFTLEMKLRKQTRKEIKELKKQFERDRILAH